MNLNDFFKEYTKVALAFSGGVDSSYLLYCGKKSGADIKAYFVKSQFQPQFELEDAKIIAKQVGADMEVIPIDILSDVAVSDNTPQRCYLCKKNIIKKIAEAASRDGYQVLIDGTNWSDQLSDRPGMSALKELRVLSPLRLCGITKEEVRRLSKEGNLFTWNKPSYACLATRIPFGQKVTQAQLTKVEKGEDCLRRLGFTDFRIRIYHGAARIQILESQYPMAINLREDILTTLKPYFDEVLLDMEGR